MNIFTAHTRGRDTPVLVREGFSWGALLFGPIWLLLQKAWIPAALVLVAELATGLAPGPWRLPLDLALAVAVGLFGRDLVRWSLERRGFLLAHVVAGRGEDEALARLLDRRPDLIDAALR